MTIDVWMQHPNADFIKNPVFDSLRRWRPGAWSESSHPIEATLAEMDKAGVTCGMLCAWWGPSGPMISNDEVAHYCRAHPDRFIVIASVDLHRPMVGVRELRRRVKQDGFKGLRIVPWLWGLPPDDRRYYPPCLPSVANLTFHSAHRLATRDRSGNPSPDVLSLIWIVPWLDEMLSLVMKYPNVFIDTSAYKVSRYPRDVNYIRESKTHRVLFGSNHPFWPAGECIEGIDKLGLSENAKTLFLTDNAKRVFKISRL